jgi:hypothetical protein
MALWGGHLTMYETINHLMEYLKAEVGVYVLMDQIQGTQQINDFQDFTTSSSSMLSNPANNCIIPCSQDFDSKGSLDHTIFE